MSVSNKLINEVRNCKDDTRLFYYSRSTYPAVVLEVARLVRTPPEILENLKNHHSVVIKHAVALNPNTSNKTLAFLQQDKDQLVRDYAKMNLNQKAIG